MKQKFENFLKKNNAYERYMIEVNTSLERIVASHEPWGFFYETFEWQPHKYWHEINKLWLAELMNGTKEV